MAHASPDPAPPHWSNIKPKVTAAGLAYAAGLAVTAVLADLNIEVSTATAQSVSGFAMLLAAYLWPGEG